MSTNYFSESIPIQLVTLLNESVRDWFQEPEHEKAYHEWLREREVLLSGKQQDRGKQV